MGAWFESQRDWLFGDPIRMSPEEFHLLREVVPSIHFIGFPYANYKTRINGQWCVVNRQTQFGTPVVFAHRIIIQLKGVPA